MKKINPIVSSEFVTMHLVDEKYHETHPQLFHRHDDVLELLYIMNGNGQYMVDGRTYVVQQGSLIVCNAGIMHGEAPHWKNNMLSYCCVLRGISLPNLPQNNLYSPSCNPVFFLSDDRSIFQHVLLALYESSLQPAASYINNLLANALLNITYIKICNRQLSDPGMQENHEEFIQNIIQFLDEHYMEPLTLAELGAKFHISQHYLSHIFKEEIGIAPIKYLMQRKIGESQNLLMNTELPLSVISDMLSFNDSAHFSRMFKKYVGLTPSEYRRNFQ